MKNMKILNLYAGIGGNRKLWGDDHEITAIEKDYEIAKIYQDFFPNDKVGVCDAHEYLLNHFEEFDFIWASPPCPTHSKACFAGVYSGDKMNYRPKYPDMKLYEEILFLKHYFKGRWVIENVIGFYEPLIKPHLLGSHYFWTNFQMVKMGMERTNREHHGGVEALQKRKGFDLSRYTGIDKIKTLRNCVEPELGLHIFKEAFTKTTLF